MPDEPFDEAEYLAKVIEEQPEQSSEVGDDPEFQVDKSLNLGDLLDNDGKVRES